jgi:hypothetical protein
VGRLLYVVFDDSNPFFDSSLMMEAARTSETSVDNYFTRQYIPEDDSELKAKAVPLHAMKALWGRGV